MKCKNSGRSLPLSVTLDKKIEFDNRTFKCSACDKIIKLRFASGADDITPYWYVPSHNELSK